MKLSLLAATALVLPSIAGAQAMPGMAMPGMNHGAHHPKPAAKPVSPAPKRTRVKAHRPAPRPSQHQAPSPAPPHAYGDHQQATARPQVDHHHADSVPPAPGPEPRSTQPQPAMDHGAMDHGGMDHSTTDHAAMNHAAMDHGDMAHGEHPAMTGALGSYRMTRDASGTSWQPETTPHMGLMGELGGGWTGMAHGNATLVWDRQGGPRGDRKTFVSSMLMGMAQHSIGSGALTLKAMGSLDPLMGKRGYPLLLATGETADGRTELVDRQHPHDAVAELSATLNQRIARDVNGFVYLAFPGEPALGPTAYFHRFSGMANPEAPITHHFLDSTHVTFGVATAGIVAGPLKLEGSLFTGREPDQRRWNFEKPRFDSWALRATLNPSPDWSMQLSRGRLTSPESLHPEEDVRRTTASATWNHAFSGGGAWQTTLAWGRNRTIGDHHGGDAHDAFLLEGAVEIGRWGAFARGEVAEKDELFGHEHGTDPLAGETFTVGKLSLGGYRTVPLGAVSVDLGALVSKFALPDDVQSRYGRSPTSVMLFTRLKLGR